MATTTTTAVDDVKAVITLREEISQVRAILTKISDALPVLNKKLDAVERVEANCKRAMRDVPTLDAVRNIAFSTVTTELKSFMTRENKQLKQLAFIHELFTSSQLAAAAVATTTTPGLAPVTRTAD